MYKRKGALMELTGQEALQIITDIQKSYRAVEVDQWCPTCQRETKHLRATCDNPTNGGAFIAAECRACGKIRMREVPDYPMPS